jgi:transcriptional regulator with XRE-family HTH domain
MTQGDLGTRTRLEMSRQGWSLRRLHQEVEAATNGATGSSYGSLHSLVRGKTYRPRPEILTALASLFGVRPDWLIHGTGERTEHEEQVRRLTEAGWRPNAGKDFREMVRASLRRNAQPVASPLITDSLPKAARLARDHLSMGQLPPHLQVLWLEVWRRLLVRSGSESATGHEMGYALQSWMTLPFAITGTVPSDDAMERYAEAAIHALMLATDMAKDERPRDSRSAGLSLEAQ